MNFSFEMLLNVNVLESLRGPLELGLSPEVFEGDCVRIRLLLPVRKEAVAFLPLNQNPSTQFSELLKKILWSNKYII